MACVRLLWATLLWLLSLASFVLDCQPEWYISAVASILTQSGAKKYPLWTLVQFPSLAYQIVLQQIVSLVTKSF